MSIFPPLALLAGFLNVVAMLFGWKLAYYPILALTCLVAVLAWNKPGDWQARANGRAMAAWAVAFALLPVIHPFVRDLARRNRERLRARETAPLYTALDKSVAGIEKPLLDFAAKYHQFPTTRGGKEFPLISPEGGLTYPEEKDRVDPPGDPFDKGAFLHFEGVGTSGTLITSSGQNKISELPPPPPNMGAFPNSPLAPLAGTGVDWRLLTYDPTNGALGGGDVVRWVGRGTREEVLRDLDAAWDRANRTAPPGVPNDKNGNQLADADGAGAQVLFDQKEYLAALALASRAVVERHPNPASWPDGAARASLVQGLCFFELGHTRAAADSLVDFLSARPNDVRAQYYLGCSLWWSGNGDEAALHFAAASQVDQADPLSGEAAKCLEALQQNKRPPVPVPAYRKRPAASGARP